jgi:ribosomal protein S18 acetylase RimI-like enzyme
MSKAARAATVRLYRDADHGAVAELWNLVFPDPSPYNEPAQSIRRMTAEAPDLFFVAELDAELVGTVLAGWDGHRGWIYSLAVAPAHRRKGLGAALLDHAVAELRRRDCPKINLQVRGDNESVIAFYERQGFVMEDRASLGRRL